MEEALFSENGQPWSKAKLLSFVINGGNKYQSVSKLAEALEDHFLDFDAIVQSDAAMLQSVRGIGPVKAKQILAMLALHKAWNTPAQPPKTVRSSGDAAVHFSAIRYLGHEEFSVLYLNRAHVPIGTKRLFRGGLTGTVTDVRLILKHAIALGSTAIIIAHNHPSGALVPSENDKRMTKKLAEASQTLDIRLLDHLIVARSGYFSFSDQGLI